MRVPAHDLDAELHRIASDPETRAVFRTELDRAMAEHVAKEAELTAFAEAAAEALQVLVRLPTREPAA
ncbi:MULTISPECIES: hypothetical protein [unclassified Streptomyces]|uniref:hypothetical protein n=1 Tax=unclassified Streptomyces TaxID=2593676 RepID=UPI0032523085